MSFEQISQAIENRVKQSTDHRKYSAWTIGITGYPVTRKQRHRSSGEDVQYWMEWEADNEDTARAVETYFLDKGMKGGEGGDLDGTIYVYIF